MVGWKSTKKKGGGTYAVAYWTEDKTYDNAVDYELSKFEIGADFICNDLVIS